MLLKLFWEDISRNCQIGVPDIVAFVLTFAPIPDLLEAIKLFTTTPKCVYVLGLDHDIVRQGIYRKYQFNDEREAEEYLEKARVLFEEMDLQWDIEQLEKVKAQQS